MAEALPQIKISNGSSKLASPVKSNTVHMMEGPGGAMPKSDTLVEGEIAIFHTQQRKPKDFTQDEATQMAAHFQLKRLQIPLQIRKTQMDE